MTSTRIISLLGIGVFAAVTTVAAQEPTQKIDITVLQGLYEQLLQDEDNAVIQQRIAEERINIRKKIDEEIAKVTEPVLTEETEQIGELPKALERQRSLVNILDQRLSERRVDLDLLQEEEKRYKDPTVATGSFVVTKSYPELLARKVDMEERIAALETAIAPQKARETKLIRQQRLEQFSVLITLGKYLLILFGIWLFETVVRHLFLSRIQDDNQRYTTNKMFASIVYVLTATWLIGVLFSKNPEIVASFAIVGAGLAIALQDVVKDMLGWFLILQNKLYSRGHRVTIGAITGEVVDINLLRTSLLEVGTQAQEKSNVLERTGKLMTIPNSLVLSQTLTNHTTTSDFVRAEMRLTITFESDWRKAQQILDAVLAEETQEHEEKEQRQTRTRGRMYYLPHRTTGRQVYLDIADDGVECTLRFTVPIGERRPTVSRMTDKILERFGAEPTVNLAYKTIRAYTENGDPFVIRNV